MSLTKKRKLNSDKVTSINNEQSEDLIGIVVEKDVVEKIKKDIIIDNKSKLNFTTELLSFQRLIPHVEGNWPSSISIEINKSRRLTYLVNLLCQYLQENSDKYFLTSPTSSHNNIYLHNNYHISLSRHFSLKKYEIDTFLNILGEKIFSSSIFNRVKLFSFKISSRFRFLMNENQSRAFICLEVQDYSDCLTSLVGNINSTLGYFNLEEYYQKPIFHISVASFIPSQIFIENYNENKTCTLPLNFYDTISPTQILPQNYYKCIHKNVDDEEGEEEIETDDENIEWLLLTNKEIISNNDSIESSNYSAISSLLHYGSDDEEIINEEMKESKNKNQLDFNTVAHISISLPLSNFICSIGNRYYELNSLEKKLKHFKTI